MQEIDKPCPLVRRELQGAWWRPGAAAVQMADQPEKYGNPEFDRAVERQDGRQRPSYLAIKQGDLNVAFGHNDSEVSGSRITTFRANGGAVGQLRGGSAVKAAWSRGEDERTGRGFGAPNQGFEPGG